MNDKKFYKPGIIFSAAAVLLSFFCFSAESVIVGIIALVISLRKRDEYRIKIPVVLSVIAIVSSLAEIIGMIYMYLSMGATTDYWLFSLIF
ncbi:MAG: hypothetical protein IJF18_06430 [Oscillospiraceae bacterium]|nr:hypothetical protein [Oscillospiraceae bacterium]